MFGTLIESRARRQYRLGGSFASVVGHAVLIAGAIVLTAEANVAATEDIVERISPLMHVAPPPEVIRQSATSASHSQMPAPAGAPALVMPTVIPVDIPAIVLSTDIPDVMYERISTSQRGVPGGSPDGVRGGTAPIPIALASGAFAADQVDKPVILKPGSPAPRYPDVLQTAGVSGNVVAEFVVDTLGHVDLSTIRIRSSDHEQFSGSVRATLPKLRFLPAELRGRKVPQLVLLPFRFDITP